MTDREALTHLRRQHVVSQDLQGMVKDCSVPELVDILLYRAEQTNGFDFVTHAQAVALVSALFKSASGKV